MAKKSVKQREIAQNLNLSVATVSKALSDYADINSNTREKVVNMASKLGYSNIRRLNTSSEQKTAFVGVLILHRIDQWQPTSFFAGMSEKCAKLNVSLVLHYVNKETCQMILDPQNQPPAMKNGQLAGLILVNRWPENIVKKLTQNIPAVAIQNYGQALNIDVVDVDEFHATDLLSNHLYNLKHKNIGFFGASKDVLWARRRFAAYVEALVRLGLEYKTENVIHIQDDVLDEKALGVEMQIDKVCRDINNGVTAWIAANDWVGYLLCRGLLNRGVRIPKDVSVTGFDDSEDNTLGCPKLTSITVPALKIGAEALRRLMIRVRHPSGPQLNVKMRCTFFEGLTTGPAPTPRTAKITPSNRNKH